MITTAVANTSGLSSVWIALKHGAVAEAAKHPFFWGVFLMMATTSLWALAFAAPLAVPDASAIEIALGRYIVYGLISVLALNPGRVMRLPTPVLWRALIFALTGNIIYYVLLVLGIQLADATTAVLIIGMLPVTISVFGRLQAGSTGIRILALPLILFGSGVILFNAARTDFFRDISEISPLGLTCIAVSLAMWTWYALANARFLRETRLITSIEWSSVIGLASLIVALISLPLSWQLGLARDPTTMTIGDLSDVAVWSLILGGGATWLGTAFFNMASRLLDVSILGQLIIFEAIFGTAYVFIFSGEAPGGLEIFGISVALFAVWLSIKRLQTAAAE